MSLGKWLTLSGSLKQIGGQGRFVLPPVYRERYEFNPVKTSNDDLNSNEKSLIKQEKASFQNNESISSDKITRQTVIVNSRQIGFEKTISVVSTPVKKKSETDEEGQLTLEGWKEKSDASGYDSQSNTAISYHSVGRWALKRVTRHKLPKPPPVQREFRFNEVKVVRNDLQFSDIEVVVKPGGRLFDKIVSYVCSLIGWINRVFFKKLKRK